MSSDTIDLVAARADAQAIVNRLRHFEKALAVIDAAHVAEERCKTADLRLKTLQTQLSDLQAQVDEAERQVQLAKASASDSIQQANTAARDHLAKLEDETEARKADHARSLDEMAKAHRAFASSYEAEIGSLKRQIEELISRRDAAKASLKEISDKVQAALPAA